LLTGPEFFWTFNNYSVSQTPLTEYFYTEEPIKEHIQFRHVFTDGYEIKSEQFKYIKSLIVSFEMNTGLKVKKFSRIKANLLMPQKGPTAQQPHVDGIGEIDGVPECIGKKTLLYYVNDSDGDTVLYDKYFTKEKIGLVKKIQSVSPKKGRAVIFDSNQVHAGCCPTTSDCRIVVNCVFEV
jgi:hypothetical protein